MTDPVSAQEEFPRAESDGDSVPMGSTVLFVPQAAEQIHSSMPNAENSLVSNLAHEISDNSKTTKRPSANHADRLVGKSLGVYRCDALLGRGAMGAVYLAFHQQLERRCALKVLSPKYVEADADYANRFREEAISVANLHHPNVVMAFAVGKQDGLHFLEMEFVAGNSLQKVLDSHPRLAPVDALRITAEIADGLAAAHRTGLIHRDVKPDNVLMTKESFGFGRAKIGDFGLAKRVRGRGEKVFDGLVGTPHYMAPELFTGAQASPSTDMYALGVCLYRMLSGRLPFNGKTVKQLMSQTMTQPFPNLRTDCPEISAEIAELVEWLVHRDPAQRAHDADLAQPRLYAAVEQIRDLRQLLSDAFANDSDITWSARENRHEFDAIVKLPHGRRQQVVIAAVDENVPFRQIQIFSIGGPASVEHFELALRRNATQPHGSIAVRDVEGQPHFVMIENHSRAKVTPEELCQSVRHIARHADEVEEFLTGHDVN